MFEDFKAAFLRLADTDIARQSGLRIDAVRRIRDALERPGLCQLGQLAQVQGIGDKTLEKSFAFVSQLRQSLAGGVPAAVHAAMEDMPQGSFDF